MNTPEQAKTIAAAHSTTGDQVNDRGRPPNLGAIRRSLDVGSLAQTSRWLDKSLRWPPTTKRVEIAIAPGGGETARPNDAEHSLAIVPAD